MGKCEEKETTYFETRHIDDKIAPLVVEEGLGQGTRWQALAADGSP